MHETDPNPTLPSSEPAEGLAASALRAHAWYGEPFLHAGEDPVAALAPGTARRAALDDAIAEIDALAGMLTELISSSQRAAEENATGNGHAVEADAAELDEEDDDFDAGVI